MKFLKAFGGFLCFIGCLAALAGIMATALPMIDNDQIRRIIESFSVKSQDAILNAVNGAILMCLHYNYWLFGCGAALLLIGGLMKTAAGNSQYKSTHIGQETTAPVSKRVNTNISAQPRSSAQSTASVVPSHTNAGISPYTAAEYGKALTSKGSQTSDIAKKYLPRSIIPADDETEGSFSKPRTKPEATQNFEDTVKSGGVVKSQTAIPFTTENAEHTGVIFCTACGEENPVNLSFCGQCGSKLPARLTVLATDAKGMGKEIADNDAYRRTPEQWKPYAKSSPNTTVDGAKQYVSHKETVESIFNVPVEPIPTSKIGTREPLSGITELRTSGEWSKGNTDASSGVKQRSPISDYPQKGNTVEERFQPAAVDDIHLNRDWQRQQEFDYSTLAKTASAERTGKPVAEDAKAKFVSRRFHSPVTAPASYNVPVQATEYVQADQNASVSGETVPADTASVPSSRRIAYKPSQQYESATSTPAATAIENNTLKPLSRARIVSTLHNGVAEDSPLTETIEMTHNGSKVPVPNTEGNSPSSMPTATFINPAPTQSNKPRIVSTMGKKSTL